VSVVVVHHHTPDLLAACIASLACGTRVPDEVIVVDNDVAPGTPAPRWDPAVPVTTIRRSMNPGYAASCNEGAAVASGDILLFLNADVAVDPDCLARCVDALRSDPAVGIVTCRLVRPDGSTDHAAHRGIPTPLASIAYLLGLDRVLPWSRALGRYRLSWLDPTTDHDVEACSGAYLMTTREALVSIGGWDERFWFYGEDLDLCVRMVERGLRVRYLGSVTATHVKGASSHLRQADSELDADAIRVKRRVQAAIVESHELFFRLHIAPNASWLEKAAARILFATQRRLSNVSS
jgi:GT2 family glycosyltransferase